MRMLSLIFPMAVILGTGIHLWLAPEPLSKAKIVEVILLYFLVFFVGLGGLLAAMGHTFRADEIALKIGWQPGSPFQFEMAMANLAFGVLGILCIWKRDGFWTATGIGFSVLLMGCTYGHLRDMLVHQNYAPYNAGAAILFQDTAIPLLILTLLWLRARLTRKGANS